MNIFVETIQIKKGKKLGNVQVEICENHKELPQEEYDSMKANLIKL